ncbi:uncharacterized protein AB675_8781 [Cyphellophora attinorum]|uniref:Flavin reductase like domain-containing protein n=1 Tax=Cyphellophora attinorum TaxID=1664694 RepID=A0A0N1H9Z7_9EURO|nr:uncharacterized protein AB675_8781 [Phialophora attinorum]KPI44542.1 hypothetical protein AB675_8781 [Phialophora attinorum]
MQQPFQHEDILPSILYFGTPTALIGTLPPNASPSTKPNIGPMSSVFWLGNHCVLGLAAESYTTQNIILLTDHSSQRNGRMYHLPASSALAANVNAIARTTGTEVVPPGKIDRNYVYCGDKFALGSFTQLPSVHIAAPGIAECPIVMEAKLVQTIDLFNDTEMPGVIKCFEVKILNVRINPELRMEGQGKENYIEPDKWKPLIMMFSHFYSLQDGKLGTSRLAEIPEEKYRGLTDYGDGGPLERIGSADRLPRGEGR